jgi:hypothetical protein
MPGVKALEAGLMLFDQLRLEGPVAVGGNFNRHLACFAFQCFQALAVARVASAVAGHLVLLIPQVVVHLTRRHPLCQRLRQFLHQPVRAYEAAAARRDQFID